MLVRRPRPSTRNPPEPAVSGGGSSLERNPRPSISGGGSSLERNPRPSMGYWKRREADDHCIGLGIVAALEKAGPSEAHPAASLVVVGASHVSAPIAISGHRSTSPHGSGRDGEAGRRRDTAGFFCVSPPAPCGDETFRVADFLSQCNLCGKRLHGKDIYMYRGEKAFCSAECRYQQIVSDEFSEKHCWSTGAAAKKTPVDAPASPYSGSGRRFFLIPSIAAA